MKFRISPANQKAYPKRFDREPGCQSILFNRDALDQYDEIILTSGEADALALLSLGFENVVATTTGEGALPAADVDALAKKSKVLVPFDNDPAGQNGVKEVAKRIGFERTFLVRLPDGVKDVNDFLVAGHSRAEFEVLLKAATQFDIPSVLSLSQALDRLEEQQTVSALDETTEVTPWPTINKILGAWKPGDLNVLSGIQKAGKTTLALNVAAFWAARGLPALLYCLEMPVERVVAHTLCAHYRVGLDEEDHLPPGIIAKARVDLADWPLYLGGNPRITGHKAVTDLIRQAVRRFGLKLVIFDNLHMLARNLDHINEEIGVITKEFKNLAMELEIPIVLIAQPRKLQENRIMSPWDLKGSVDIYSDADSIVMLHREQLGSTESRDAVAAAVEAEDGIHGDEQDNWSPVTTVRVVSRYRPSRDRLLYFEGAEKRFRQLTEVERELAKRGDLK
jgi:twinkle protein